MKKLETRDFDLLTIPQQQNIMKVIEDNAKILSIQKMKITEIVHKIGKDMNYSRNLVMRYTDTKKFRDMHDQYYKRRQ